jgi:AcrR family transcriptional regulator
VRREPQQARSRARVERLLEAGDAVLAAEGFEALTVRRIAANAGVPIGTLYQFFPDKQAIVDALAYRYLGEFEVAMEDLVGRAERERWDDPVEVLFATFVNLYQSRPGYLALWVGRHLSADLRRADEANNELIADGIRRVLIAQLGLSDGEELARACEVTVRVCDALLQYAFRNGAPADADVLAEMIRLQRLYLADLVARYEPVGRAAGGDLSPAARILFGGVAPE